MQTAPVRELRVLRRQVNNMTYLTLINIVSETRRAGLGWPRSTPQMLSLLLALEYKCEATVKVEGKKRTTGGDCPKDVACAKMSIKDF